jgi:hypothetical protein
MDEYKKLITKLNTEKEKKTKKPTETKGKETKTAK